MYIQDDLKKCLKLQFRDITYKVNEEKGVVSDKKCNRKSDKMEK